MVDVHAGQIERDQPRGRITRSSGIGTLRFLPPRRPCIVRLHLSHVVTHEVQDADTGCYPIPVDAQSCHRELQVMSLPQRGELPEHGRAVGCRLIAARGINIAYPLLVLVQPITARG